MIVAIVLTIAMALSLIVLNVAKTQLVGQVKNSANVPAVTVIWNDLTRNLIKAEVGGLVFGLVVALGFAIAGPYGWAVWLRRKTGYLFELERDRRLKGKESGPVGIFFAQHIWGLRVAGAAVLFAILYLVRPLSAGKVLIFLIIYVVYLVICELLRGRLPGSAEAVGPEGEAAQVGVPREEGEPAEEEKASEGGSPSKPPEEQKRLEGSTGKKTESPPRSGSSARGEEAPKQEREPKPEGDND
jgi:hypothetical protein